MMDVKVSKDISRWIDRKNPIMLDEIESKTLHKNKESDQERKKK